jgi:hypothetical protein
MLSIELECFLQGWNPLDRVRNAFYRVDMLSTELEDLCIGLKFFLEFWNTFDRVGIPLYTVGMLSTGLECFRQCWYTFEQSCNAF